MKQSARLLLALVLLGCFSQSVTAQVTAEWHATRYHKIWTNALSSVRYFRVTSGSGYIDLVATLDATGNSITTRMWVEEGITYETELKIGFDGRRDAAYLERCFTVKFDSEAFSAPGVNTFHSSPNSFNSKYWCPVTPTISVQDGDEFLVNASDGTFADHVRITWNEVVGATSYQVYRCTEVVDSACGAPIGSPVSNGFDDTGGVDEESYWYRVKACIKSECGDFSKSDEGYRGGDDHGNSCAEATPVSVNSTTPGFLEEVYPPYSGPGDYDYFRIYVHAAGTLTVNTSGSTETAGTLLDDTCTEITDDDDGGDGQNFQISRDLQAGTYYVSVGGDYSWKTGPYQFVSSFDGPPVPVPASPTGINATDGKYTDHVQVTFNPVDGAFIYRIYRCMTAAQSTCGSPLGSVKTTSFDDKGAVPGTVYFYRAQACIPGVCGLLSMANSGFARLIPAQPGGINASDGDYDDWTRVSWNAVPGTMAYQVFRCGGPGSETCGSAIGSTATTGLDDPNCATGKKYWYRVKACASRECSAFSAADEGYRGQLPQDRAWAPANRFVSFDDDGKDDVLLRHRVEGSWYINFMNWRLVRPNSGLTPLFKNQVWEMMGTGDFNGDGRGDILLRNNVGGGWWIYLMNGRMRTGGATSITKNPDWVIAGIDDFDGDGKDDVLLRNRVTGRWYINFMESRDVRADSGLTPITNDPDWMMMGTGDFNGDGRGDVLLRNKDTGEWWIYLMNGRDINSGATAITTDLDWFIAGIDDFDEDGKDDVMLRHRITGEWQINFMKWRMVRPDSGPTLMTSDLDWEMMGTGDFNGDGRGDVLLRNKNTGGWWIYLMNGLAFNSGATAITMDLDWEVSKFTGESQDSPADEHILSWHTNMGSVSQDYAHAVAVDGSGNIYVAGWTESTWGTPIHPYAGNRDAFVAKLTSSGERLWHTFMGSSGWDEGLSVAADGDGNVYVTGTSVASWGTPVNSHAGGDDGFAVKLNSDGERQWHTFMGHDGTDWGRAIAVDTSGTVYVAGVGGGWWGTLPVDQPPGNADVWVTELSADGVRQWYTFVGSEDLDFIRSMAVDGDGNVFVAGRSIASWGSPINPFVSEAGESDALVAKLNTSGELLWHTFMGSAGEDYGLGIAVDGNGNAYFSGNSPATWGTPINPFVSEFGGEGFTAKLNSSGVRQWHTFLGSEGVGFGWGLAIDESRNIFVGDWWASVQLSPDGIIQQNFTIPHGGSGEYQPIAVDTSGNVYFAGGMAGDWWIEPISTAIVPYAGGGGWDACVVKFEPPSS